MTVEQYKLLEKRAIRLLESAEELGPTGDGVLTNAMLNSLQRMVFAGLDRKLPKKQRSLMNAARAVERGKPCQKVAKRRSSRNKQQLK